MSDLTISLAILGVLVLAAMVAHATWQIRRAGPKRASEAGSDISSQAQERLERTLERKEPTLDTAKLALEGDATEERANPVVGDSPTNVMTPPVKRPTVKLDVLIDAIAPISLDAPVSGEMLLSHLPPSRRAGSKPMLIEGLNSHSGEWEFPQPGQRYREVQAGVQLANRSGALNEIEFSEFAQKLSLLAEALGGMVEIPDMLDATARAKELDAFASEHDAQLAIHLRARGAAWSVGYIQQHARRHGFLPGALPGRLVLPAKGEDGAPAILTMTFDAQAALADDPSQSAVRDVTLSFDVPQTDPSSQPFEAWQASAQALSLGMDASIVDDNGQPLSQEGFSTIRGELGRLYEALSKRDLAAGSGLARRLFS